MIGVISDTHGLLRPEALKALRGSLHIIHAGDVGSPEILEELSAIAPLTVVRGNVDKGAWALKLPETEDLEVGGVSIYVLHDLAQLDLKPRSAGFAAVVSGHSHVPKQETRDGVSLLQSGKRWSAKVQTSGERWEANRGGWEGSGRTHEPTALGPAENAVCICQGQKPIVALQRREPVPAQ